MKSIDFNHNNKIFTDLSDETLLIPKAHLDAVCKISCGEKTCRYIGLGVNGFICSKHTELRNILDKKATEDKMVAKGNNCDGFGLELSRGNNVEEKT